MTGIPRNKRTESQFNAYIDYYLTFFNYLNQYKTCFDVLVAEVQRTNSHVDYLAYPILFSARHCMELGFKANIRYFAKYSGKKDYITGGTHNLEGLFQGFQTHVEATFEVLKNEHGITIETADKNGFKDLCNEVSKLNQIFHQLDTNSDAFRYPVDKKQNPSFNKGERIDVIAVSELLEKSMLLFRCTADVFAKYTNYIDQINDYYEEMMREQYEQNIPH